jgi:hypothetical protein
MFDATAVDVAQARAAARSSWFTRQNFGLARANQR